MPRWLSPFDRLDPATDSARLGCDPPRVRRASGGGATEGFDEIGTPQLGRDSAHPESLFRASDGSCIALAADCAGQPLPADDHVRGHRWPAGGGQSRCSLGVFRDRAFRSGFGPGRQQHDQRLPRPRNGHRSGRVPARPGRPAPDPLGFDLEDRPDPRDRARRPARPRNHSVPHRNSGLARGGFRVARALRRSRLRCAAHST